MASKFRTAAAGSLFMSDSVWAAFDLFEKVVIGHLEQQLKEIKDSIPKRLENVTKGPRPLGQTADEILARHRGTQDFSRGQAGELLVDALELRDREWLEHLRNKI